MGTPKPEFENAASDILFDEIVILVEKNPMNSCKVMTSYILTLVDFGLFTCDLKICLQFYSVIERSKLTPYTLTEAKQLNDMVNIECSFGIHK